MRVNTLKKETVNYDGITKHLLDNMNDRTMIQFINSTFDRKFSSDSTVVRLATETSDEETRQKRCDYFVKIGDDFFLIEIQSYEDDEMAIRIFEYGSRGAMLHSNGKNGSDTIELQLPEPVVFYLRKEGTVRDRLSVKLRRTGSNETFDYEAKVVYVEDYDFDSMMENSMFPLIPFYPMRYEKMLKRKHSSQDENDMLTDLTGGYEKLKNAVKAGKLGGTYFQYMSMSMSNVFKSMIERMKKYGNVHNEKEAKEVMQKMVDEPMEILDIFGALKESKEEGIEEGRKEGREEGEITGMKRGVLAGKIIFDMYNKGKEDNEIITELMSKLNITAEAAAEILGQYR